jgi:hypothetical protein
VNYTDFGWFHTCNDLLLPIPPEGAGKTIRKKALSADANNAFCRAIGLNSEAITSDGSD